MTSHPETPPHGLVWHYTDGPGLLSILSGHCLWATSSEFLNDAQEVALGLGRIRGRLEQLAIDDELFRVIIDSLTPRDVDIDLAATCYILSASQSWDSLAMWRLYGGTRESYAIGLDPSARLSVLGDGEPLGDQDLASAGVYLKRMRWEPVRYRPEEQSRLVEAAVDDLPGQLRQVRAALTELDVRRPSLLPETTWSLVREVIDDLEQALVLIKHEGFADEREVRQAIMMHARGDDPRAVDLESRLLRYRASGYGIAPYLRLTGGTDESSVVAAPSPLPVRAVAISPSPHGAAAEHSLRRVLHASDYHDVPVVRSAIPYRSQGG